MMRRKRRNHSAGRAESQTLAKQQLQRLATSLEREHPDAAASPRQGLEETLTVQRFGLDCALARTLRTTNPIENHNRFVETYTRNVKRWRGDKMIQRWVCAALSQAAKKFRRLRGYRDMLGYTSVGAGTSIVNVRLNCLPEVTLHRLRPDRTP